MLRTALRQAIAGPWLRDPLWTRARAVPTLDLDFAGTGSLRDRVSGLDLVTVTRASNGTRITSQGVLETLGNDVPRFTHDPSTGRALGLLVEEARTNLLLNSATLSTQSVTVAATAHTLHFTGTGTITLSGASTAGPLVGTGTGEASRVALTFTPSAGTLTLTVSGTVSNAQLEAGSFRTSWIPTTGTSANRAADVATITGTNFSRWYRQDEGTLFCSAAEYPFVSTASRSYYGIDATSTPNSNFIRQWIWSGSTGSLSHSIYTSSSGPVAAEFSQSIATTEQRITALAVKANDFARSYRGNTVATDTSGNMPVSVDRMGIGISGSSAQHLNGTISRITYWPRRLSNPALQELTR